MANERESLAGTIQAKRSIVVACLTVALLAAALTFLVDGAIRAITIIAIVAATVAAFRGLPDALIDLAVRRSGPAYFRFFSFALPIGAIAVSIYLGWLFWSIRSSDLLVDYPLELLISILAVAGLLNLAVVVFNAVAEE